MPRIQNTTILVLAFALGTLSFTFGTLYHVYERDAFQWQELAERRPVNTLPAWTFQEGDMRRFFSSLEPYLCDRAAWRTPLLVLKTRLSYAMGQSLNPHMLVVGRDGWLFFGNAMDRNMDKYMGRVQFTPESWDARTQYFTALSHYLDTLGGIPFILAVVPGKANVYPEFLPGRFPVKDRPLYDQAMAMKLPGAHLDLKSVFAEAKKQSDWPLYYQCDSHWNDYGAYVAYREIMNLLMPALRVEPIPFPDDYFELVTDHYGEQLDFLGKGIRLVHTRPEIRKGVLSTDLDKKSSDDLITWKQLPPDSDANTVRDPFTRILNPRKKGRLLVIGDSFTVHLSKYLSETFGEVVYTHYKQDNHVPVSALVSLFHPDAVLFVTGERKIDDVRYLMIEPEGAHVQWTDCASPELEQFKAMIRSTHMLEAPAIERDGLRLTCDGPDGYFAFEYPANWREVEQVRICVTLTAEQEDILQLFYATARAHQFSEQQSIRRSLLPGTHRYTFILDKPDLTGRFRLDLGTTPGQYVLSNPEICIKTTTNQ